MVDSVFTGSMVVVDEVAAGAVDDARFPEQPAVPDAGSEREDALADSDPHAFRDATTVLLEVELVLGGVVDRLDPLAHAAELAEPGLLVFAVGAHERGFKGGDDLL